MAKTRKTGRDAGTGRFLSVKEAQKKKTTAVVETVKNPSPTKEKPSPKKKK